MAIGKEILPAHLRSKALIPITLAIVGFSTPACLGVFGNGQEPSEIIAKELAVAQLPSGSCEQEKILWRKNPTASNDLGRRIDNVLSLMEQSQNPLFAESTIAYQKLGLDFTIDGEKGWKKRTLVRFPTGDDYKSKGIIHVGKDILFFNNITIAAEMAREIKRAEIVFRKISENPNFLREYYDNEKVRDEIELEAQKFYTTLVFNQMLLGFHSSSKTTQDKIAVLIKCNDDQVCLEERMKKQLLPKQ